MSPSTSWLVVLVVCAAAVPLVYLIDWGAGRLRRWWRGRSLR